MAAHRIEGHCHCGNIRWALQTVQPREAIALRICRCDFCLRHRPRYWSDPLGTLDVSFREPREVQRYRFGHGTAEFVLCRTCGVFAFAVAAIDGGYFAVTNLNLALGRDDNMPETSIEALDENESERTARRRRNWTPLTTGWPPAAGET